MGDHSVGKTSIIKAFMEGRSQAGERSERSKMVSDFSKLIDVVVDGKRYRIKLNIWDASGDGEVHNLAHLFLRDVTVGVLVFGIN